MKGRENPPRKTMLTIDLAGEPIEARDIDQVVESLSLQDLFITADLKGFERLMKVFDGFVGVPQSSAGTIFEIGRASCRERV